MSDDSSSGLSAAEQHDFRRLAGIMVPASEAFGLPGADDEAIFADITASLGRDCEAVRQAVQELGRCAGGSFASLDEAGAEAAAMAFLDGQGPAVIALGRAVLQCYYRDARVQRALGRTPGPPFPKGHPLDAGDLGLLAAVRKRPRMWRDTDGAWRERGGADGHDAA